MQPVELNLDGLVGQTHNYSGLAFGNVASQNNKEQIASPRAAALQGLAKMKALHDLGFAQGVIPPQERPSVATLRRLGFSGSDSQVIEKSAKQAPKTAASLLARLPAFGRSPIGATVWPVHRPKVPRLLRQNG